jgi:predicted dehydrogenase
MAILDECFNFAHPNMEISRRKFISGTVTLAAGIGLFPSLAGTSCKPAGRTGEVRMGFVGPEEHFRYYRPVFQKLRRARVELISLEDVLESDLHAVFLAAHPNIKPVNILLLLEKGKDVITTYPLALDLDSYNRIQEYLVHFDRRLGMLNPPLFYPAATSLKDRMAEEGPVLSKIHVSCHPRQLVSGYPIEGFAGAVQPLQRLVSIITGQFPVSLTVAGDRQKGILQYTLDYESFEAILETDPGQTGWILQVSGPEFSGLVDHTGILRLEDEPEPRISPSPAAWNRAMTSNLEDFLRAVRTREEPLVNSLDGLASIILNQAAGRSLHYGSKVEL